MKTKAIPSTSLPAFAVCDQGESLYETFSAKYREKLPNSLIREVAGTFKSTDGLNLNGIRTSNRELNNLCKFIAITDKEKTIRVLTDITPQFLFKYLEELKLTHPTRSGKNGQTYPWHKKFIGLQGVIGPFFPVDVFPKYRKPTSSVVEGHTPYAMKMLLLACRKEIDRIRNKIGKWGRAVKAGRVLNIVWFEQMTPGLTSFLTEEQINRLEEHFFDETFRSPDPVLANKYGVKDPRTIKAFRQSIAQGKDYKSPSIQALTANQIKRLKKDMLLPERPLNADVAKRHDLTPNYFRGVKSQWLSAGRVDGRPTAKFSIDDIKLDTNDIIATIHHYLPAWPVIGKLEHGPYRVYKYKQGPLHAVFKEEAEAEAEADRIVGVVSTIGESPNKSEMNPGELFLAYRNQTPRANGSGISKLAIKIQSLPASPAKLQHDYWATSYDWTVIYLYWICLTGWNKEAVRSVPRLQLKQLIKRGGGVSDLLSDDHITLTVELETVENMNKELPQLKGLKDRGQPKDEPKIFTHTSTKDEKYGLFQVLCDFDDLTRPLRKYLTADQNACILIGVSTGNAPLSWFGVCDTDRKDGPHAQIANFFRNNEIYDDEGCAGRIISTTASVLRTTYFATHQFMGVPINTLAFLGRHNSTDTTMLSYVDDGVSRTIIKQNARKSVIELERKAFTGTLDPYIQTPIKGQGLANVKAFTFRTNDIMLCKDHHRPTWPGNENYLERNKRGATLEPCEYSNKCVFCARCIITTTTLPYLVVWLQDIIAWKESSGLGSAFHDWPVFMFERYQVIREIFELCEASGKEWQEAVREAKIQAASVDFIAPSIWGSI